MRRLSRRPSSFATYLVAGTITVMALAPIVWMVIASFMPLAETVKFPPVLWPRPVTTAAYRTILRSYPFGDWLRNSLIISFSITVGSLATCSMAAYALSRLRFRGKNLVFMAVLGTLIIPFSARMIPIFIEMREAHLLNTWFPIIVPGILGNAFGIFLMRQSFMTFPRELDEASRLDGCNPWQTLVKIYMPASKPALTALAVLTFVLSWNAFTVPLVFINSPNLMPVSLGIAFLKGEATASWSWLMAGAVLASAPLLILYGVAQRQVISGMTLGSGR